MKFPLIGNERTAENIKKMLDSHRIPHAVLIEGEEGLGKTELAWYLCRAAVCESENTPCGSCDACRLVKNGNHPDVKYITLEGDKKSISVAAVRDIISEAYILPQRGKKKVFIIDDAQFLTVQAQNAILKILEEPPESIVFILTVSSRSVLLETVVSRCAVVTLCAPDFNTVCEHFSSLGFRDKNEVLSAFKAANGSVGRMLGILRGKTVFGTDATVQEFLKILQSGNEYDMLKLLSPLEKDRNAALDFYNMLEINLVRFQRECTSPTLIKRYDRIYNKTQEHKKFLKTNANLPLLLSTFAVSAMTER